MHTWVCYMYNLYAIVVKISQVQVGVFSVLDDRHGVIRQLLDGVARKSH